MRRTALLMSLLTQSVLPLSSSLAQTTTIQPVRVSCALAEKIDLQSFTLLRGARTELDYDDAAFAYSACLAERLSRELRNQPQLAARLTRLRGLYTKLNQAEGRLSSAISGGGTLYIHNVARTSPNIEQVLRTLAALASGPSGGRTGPQFTESLALSREAFLKRVAALKSWRPKPPAGFAYDPATFQRDVTQYEQAGRAVMGLLGRREDAATAAGYSAPFSFAPYLDDFLADADLGGSH